jgi:hypothetical protein
MRRFLIVATAAAAAFTGFAATEANAVPMSQGIEAPAVIEQAACAVRRERIVRPNGRVVHRTVRRCGPGIGRSRERCRVVRERITRPNGRVVVRTVRRCGHPEFRI